MRFRSQPATSEQTDMQNSSIELKSSKYTLTLVMDAAAPFEQILSDVTDKFRSSARFFRGAQMALEFRGKALTPKQQHDITIAIRQSCGLDIICILEKDEENEQAQYKAITQVLKDRPQEAGRDAEDADAMIQALPLADVHRGSIKNGQKVFSDRSILILGDVEPLAEVSCRESIFVAGYALGTLRAGLGHDPKSFAAGLVLKPQNLEVCGRRSFSGIRKKTMDDSYTISPLAATVEDGHLKLTAITASAWSHFFEKAGDNACSDSIN